jgi:hypothetical protein
LFSAHALGIPVLGFHSNVFSALSMLLSCFFLSFSYVFAYPLLLMMLFPYFSYIDFFHELSSRSFFQMYIVIMFVSLLARGKAGLPGEGEGSLFLSTSR